MGFMIDPSEVDRARLEMDKAAKYLDIVVEVLQWKATLSLEEILMLNDEKFRFQINYLGVSKEDYIKYLTISDKMNELDRQFLLCSNKGKIYDINKGDYMDKKTAYDRYCGGYAQAVKIGELVSDAKEQTTLHEQDIMRKYPEYGKDLAAILGVNKEDYVLKAEKVREQSRALMDNLLPKDDSRGEQGFGGRRMG